MSKLNGQFNTNKSRKLILRVIISASLLTSNVTAIASGLDSAENNQIEEIHSYKNTIGQLSHDRPFVSYLIPSTKQHDMELIKRLFETAMVEAKEQKLASLIAIGLEQNHKIYIFISGKESSVKGKNLIEYYSSSDLDEHQKYNLTVKALIKQLSTDIDVVDNVLLESLWRSRHLAKLKPTTEDVFRNHCEITGIEESLCQQMIVARAMKQPELIK